MTLDLFKGGVPPKVVLSETAPIVPYFTKRVGAFFISPVLSSIGRTNLISYFFCLIVRAITIMIKIKNTVGKIIARIRPV